MSDSLPHNAISPEVADRLVSTFADDGIDVDSYTLRIVGAVAAQLAGELGKAAVLDMEPLDFLELVIERFRAVTERHARIALGTDRLLSSVLLGHISDEVFVDVHREDIDASRAKRYR